MLDLGRSASEHWLAADFSVVGVRSTMNRSAFAGSVLDLIPSTESLEAA
jgi:hypothetical protein